MNFQKKRLLILGCGISGRGAAALARRLGATAIPVDAGVPADRKQQPAESVFGWTPEMSLPPADFAVISPGVPFTSPMAEAVRKQGIPLIGELEFAWLANPCRIVAITGTNGKTTTTELTTALLCANGIRAESAGNIGNSLSAAVSDVLEKNNLDTLVVEASSFQLETVKTFPPSAGGGLNLACDHCTRHGSMEEYARAKQNLFRAMKNGSAVLNANLPERYAAEIRSHCRTITFSASLPADFHFDGSQIFYGKRPVLRADSLRLKGVHNVENVMAALAILSAEAGDDAVFSDAARETLIGFRPDIHRMEFFAEHSGVHFVEDS